MTETARHEFNVDVPRQVPCEQMAMSRDGRFLAFMRPTTKDAWVYDVPNRRVVLELKIPASRIHSSLGLNEHGGLLAVDSQPGNLGLRRGQRRAARHSSGHQSEGIDVSFQPHGDLLASQSWDSTTRLWDPIRGRLVVALPGTISWLGRNGSNLVIGRDHDLILYQTPPALRSGKPLIAGCWANGPEPQVFGPARRRIQSGRPDDRDGESGPRGCA